MTRRRDDLVRLLQFAFSSERGAALAYRGHAASLHDPRERAHVLAIRAEELDHRRRVGQILAALDARPDPLLELRNLCLGGAIAAFCRVGGWFLPMYGAGFIERRNLAEYERAARLALECAAAAHADDLLDMAEAEWEHERYFREKAASHRFARLLPVWSAPGPKSAIRALAGELPQGDRAGVAGEAGDRVGRAACTAGGLSMHMAAAGCVVEDTCATEDDPIAVVGAGAHAVGAISPHEQLPRRSPDGHQVVIGEAGRGWVLRRRNARTGDWTGEVDEADEVLGRLRARRR
jgi:hypothetical protein